jgi:hypothetical protein
MDRARRPRIRRTDLIVAATALLAGAGGATSTLAVMHATLGRNVTTPAITGPPRPGPGPAAARRVVLDVGPRPAR